MTRGVLLCLSHAGASGAEYRRWAAAFPGRNVVCVCLPGRDGRFKEPFLTSVESMASFAISDPAVTGSSDVALFGHSLGAYVAYEIAHTLERRGQVASALVIAGQHPPRPPAKKVHDLPPRELLAELESLGGLDPALTEDPELFEVLLPRLRADLGAAYRYTPPPRSLLSCPVLSLGGSRDIEVSVEDVEAWREHTRGNFESRIFDGDHFFVRPRSSEVARTIEGFLTRSTLHV